ncbi:MAG: ATP-binding protein [Deltaproteobacteria bacterium]|nr:ATP-binding protein [Deltaproteobacteria bacterium]
MTLNDLKKSLLSIALLCFILSGCSAYDKRPLAKKGLLDLTSSEFEKNRIVNLDGQWEFYWNKLLSPEDFRSGVQFESTGYIDLPQTWDDYNLDGKNLQTDGYATFRLLLKIKEDDEFKALRVTKVLSAYNLWVNGKLLATSGTVGVSHVTEKPRLSQIICRIEPGSDELELILQISNHNYRNGGLMSSISFGSEEQIHKSQNRERALTIFILSALMVMGGYHFVLYMLRRKDLAPLFFGLYCLFWVVNNLFSSPSGWLIQFILPHTSWTVFYRIGLMAYYLSNPVFIMFLYSLFPRECSVAVIRIYQFIGVIFSLPLFFMSVKLMSHAVPVYHLFTFILIFYSIYLLVKAVLRKREGALIILAGFGIIAVSGANDMLHDSRVIDTGYIIPTGLLIFIIFQSFVLSMRFSRAFSSVEKLSGDLEEKNITLARVDKIKDEFLANTSHELRTPLNGIIGIAESLVAGAGGKLPEKAAQNLSLIAGSARRLAGQVNNILDFSRLKNKDVDLVRGPADLHALSDMAIAVLNPLAAGKGLKLNNAVSAYLPFVEGDENRLLQILYNLIGNAIKFTDRGEVTLSAEVSHQKVSVAISDTGIGIPEEKLDAIFLSYEQVDSSSSRRFGGTGLGLAITKQLVELHGGTISVESKIDKGSTFRFTLPAISNDPVNGEGMNKSTFIDSEPLSSTELTYPEYRIKEYSLKKDGAGEKPSILVVDDEPVNLQVAVNHLTLAGMKVHTAGCGIEALESLAEGKNYDLILLDIMMPGMTGYEVCRKLRETYAAAELPIIMLTARNRVPDIVEGLERGANDYIIKPLIREVLVARVRSHLKVKDSFEALKENTRLKKEIERRRETEQDLRLMQRRLSMMLDTVNEAVIAVNESGEITFCNGACEALAGYTAEYLLGKAMGNLFADDTAQELTSLIINDGGCELRTGGPKAYPGITLKKESGQKVFVDMALTPIEIEEELLYILGLQLPDEVSGGSGNGQGLLSRLSVLGELNKNRESIRSLEEKLSDLLPQIKSEEAGLLEDLKVIESTLDHVSHTLLGEEEKKDRSLLAVEVMNLALEYWVEATGKTKIDLALESKLWKVYTNLDGWERAQTLDRYLDIDTMPKNPRWKKVMATADFVLACCSASSPRREALQGALVKFRFSG